MCAHTWMRCKDICMQGCIHAAIVRDAATTKKPSASRENNTKEMTLFLADVPSHCCTRPFHPPSISAVVVQHCTVLLSPPCCGGSRQGSAMLQPRPTALRAVLGLRHAAGRAPEKHGQILLGILIAHRYALLDQQSRHKCFKGTS